MKNGAFQIARKLFDSELWNKKPASWTKIWVYILGRVNYKDSKNCKKGEGFFNFAQEYKEMGGDITKDKIKKFTKYALQKRMISTSRSTRGMYIKVLKYPTYQNLSNYQAPIEAPQKSFSGTSKALPKHHDSKERKKGKKKNDFEIQNLPLKELKKQIMDDDITIEAIDEHGCPTTPKKKGPPINKSAFYLQRLFMDMCHKELEFRPDWNNGGYVLLTRWLKKDMTVKELEECIKDWFNEPEPEEHLIHITRCLSVNRVNRWKFENK